MSDAGIFVAPSLEKALHPLHASAEALHPSSACLGLSAATLRTSAYVRSASRLS